MMRKLLLKILALIGIVLLLNAAFYRVVIQPTESYSWGYDVLHAKRMYLKDHQNEINTAFIGSSAMYRHINPQVFDQHCDSSLQVRSFNFGIPAMFPLQAEYVYRNLLKIDQPQLKYVFMDLFEVGNLFLILNVQRKRTHYWYSFRDYLRALKITGQYDSPGYVRGTAYLSYTVAYLARLFNAEIVEEVLLTKKHSDYNQFPPLRDNRNGYYSLDREYEDTKDESDAMQNRMDMFKKDTLQNTKLLLASKSGMSLGEDAHKVNDLHLQMIEDLIALSEANGIHLIFMLHPRMQRYEYPMVMPLYHRIPERNKINMNDAARYPQFYEARYTFDPLHLNEAGADNFSSNLAEEFNRIIQTN